MSQGGAFSLVLQDDSSDRFFTAFDMLNRRLSNIYRNTGVIPNTKDIEQSHLLYIKSRYVPYVAIASEYIKVKPIGGSNSVLGRSNTTIQFNLPSYGDFTNDIVLHIKFGAVGSKTAYDENIDPTETTPLYRYCAYPGIRLLENVELKSNNILIDSYYPEDVISYKNFFVKSDHKPGWGRCYGQDEIQNASYNSKSFTGILNYSDGAQTPKLYQEEFNMFIPLNFWFCEDVSNALINEKVTNSQRVIKIEMASIDKMIQALIYEIYVNNSTEELNKNIVPFSTKQVPLPISRIKCEPTLYVNNLFTYPYIYNIISNELNFNLIRCHKRQISPLLAPSDFIKLTQLHYPCEFLSVGFRNKNNVNDFDRWHLMGSELLTADQNHVKTLSVPVIIWNQTQSIHQLVTRDAIRITTMQNIINTLSVSVYGGISLYPEVAANFYNDYLPIKYSKNTAVVSPYDNNMFLITFCLYPGKFNPSGYFNLSTSREIYINYSLNEDYRDLYNYSYEMIASMSALNFLIRQGDTITLKYAL